MASSPLDTRLRDGALRRLLREHGTCCRPDRGATEGERPERTRAPCTRPCRLFAFWVTGRGWLAGGQYSQFWRGPRAAASSRPPLERSGAGPLVEPRPRRWRFSSVETFCGLSRLAPTVSVRVLARGRRCRVRPSWTAGPPGPPSVPVR